VQYLLDTGEEPAGRLRAELADLGDSVVVVGSGDGVWNVHVHTNDVGAAVEAGVQAGRPYRITVIRFADQIAADRAAADRATADRAAADRATADRPARDGTAVLVIAPDSDLAGLFRAEGVLVVRGNPSTGELLAAIDGSGAARVVVLPNHRDRTAVAVRRPRRQERSASSRGGAHPPRRCRGWPRWRYTTRPGGSTTM